MEGACVYLDNNIPTISLYKAISSNRVLHVIYSNRKINYCIITLKELTIVLPRDCIYILTKLPFCNNIDNTLSCWRIIVLNKLLKLNKSHKSNKSNKSNKSIKSNKSAKVTRLI